VKCIIDVGKAGFPAVTVDELLNSVQQNERIPFRIRPFETLKVLLEGIQIFLEGSRKIW